MVEAPGDGEELLVDDHLFDINTQSVLLQEVTEFIASNQVDWRVRVTMGFYLASKSIR